jgi:arginase
MEIKIIKNRSDIGAGTRGSDMGIDALEIAAINSDNDFFNKYVFEDIKTHNETIYQKNTNSFAKRIEHVVEQCNRVCLSVEKSISEGFFTIVLSGDHSSALGTISGIKRANQDKKLGIVWIDAHADLHSPFTSPSGNIHGMPLAAALNLDNEEYKINEVEANTLKCWEALKNIGIIGPKINPSNIILIGLRDYEEAEEQVIAEHNISHFKVEEMRVIGISNCIKKCLDQLHDCDIIYLSFDVDSMDCDQISYGTGTPAKSGFLPEEIILILESFIETKKVCCLEVAEINPLLDNKGNKMAETVFQILENIEHKILKL